MKQKTESYRTRTFRAIQDVRLKESIGVIQERIGKGAMKFWDKGHNRDLRRRVKKNRMESLEYLDILLAELAKKIRKNGGKVFFASTAREAVEYTCRVAEKNGVKRVVKGKSMLTHEIGLDSELEKMGIEVLETDLGEFIVQLAGDKPSHIIAPCIHMNKTQISDLFNEKLGVKKTENPEELTRAARKILRQKMLSADMAVTGCNLACAETGQVSLVSNEGNIRMATTLPKVHVAVMGMERIVTTLKDHSETVQLLTQSAALQDISTYLSFVGRQSVAGSGDGPEEFHLVVVDNGRSKILGDTEFKEVLSCIRCGGCLNVCPVYGHVGGHAYNSVYPGPIGAVLSPLLEGVNKYADLCKGETLCGACKDVCPVENDIPRMLLVLRKHLANGSDYWNVKKQGRIEGWGWSLFSSLISRPFLYRLFVKSGRNLMKPFQKEGGWINSVPGFASGWTKNRALRPMASMTFYERWKQNQKKNSSKLGD